MSTTRTSHASIRKYPRTPHLTGSKLQPGDEDLPPTSFSELADKHLIVEEKVDGANSGISFGPDGQLRLQSRGHYLTGGPRERHFALFKTWAGVHVDVLRELLGQRYTMYGEWLYARHTVFYDALPHYFLEFDLYDTERGEFLSTEARRALLAGSPVCSVPVLHEGPLPGIEALQRLLARSRYKSPSWESSLRRAAATHENARWGSVDRAIAETDPSDLAEGLYLKVEDGGRVQARYKWVRASFSDQVQAADSHWLSRPIVPNGLAEGVSLW